jgi:NADH-quinone oxidoreductase subunit C
VTEVLSSPRASGRAGTEALRDRLARKFSSGGIVAVEPFEGILARVRFEPAHALELWRYLRDDEDFRHFSTVGAIDWETHREVFYILWSDSRRVYLLLSAELPAENPRIESATQVWPSANWHEREAWEMVGVEFDHHPDLRHLLMPDGYAFRPLLRSFKLHEPEELEVKTRDV